MKLREDIVEHYRFYHKILEAIFAKAFNESKYDYSILFGPILAQTIGRLYNRDISLYQEYNSHKLDFAEEYSAHLVKYMAVQSKEAITFKHVSLLRSIFATLRWFIYWFLVVIKIRLFRCRCAVDICDSKPDIYRRLSYLIFTKYIVPPTLSNAVRKIYFKISSFFIDEITTNDFINIYHNFIESIEDLKYEDRVVLHNVLLGLSSDEILHFNANQVLARFLYSNFHFELLNSFYFDSVIAHAICARDDLGCTFKVMQHGGGYGVLDGNIYELFETEQFGADFYYLIPHDIKNGFKESIPRRWSHLPVVNTNLKKCRRTVLVLARTYNPLELLTARSDIEGNTNLIVQIISILRSMDDSLILDVLPYDSFQAEELNSITLLNIPNVNIIDRSNIKYKLEEYSLILFDNFGSLFYECLTRRLTPVVVNIFSSSSYQKDWEERVNIYINDGHFVWDVADLYNIVKSRIATLDNI